MAIIAVALAAVAGTTSVARNLEAKTVDVRFGVRGDRHPSRDIVIVALDAQTLSSLRHRPPLPRSYHARLIRRLRADGARVIAYDFQFIDPTSAAQDDSLIAAIAAARPVLLATHDTDAGPVPVPAGVRDPASIGAVLASVAVLNDNDLKIRRLLYEPVALKSFDVRAAELMLGHPVSESRFSDNAAWIDYAGPPGTYPTYSFAAVLRGAVPASVFRGKLVIVGATDPIEKDVFPTPVSDDLMSGAEVHANAIATVLAGFPLRPAADVIDFLLTLLLGAVAPVAGMRLKPVRALACALLALLVYLGAAQVAFDAGRILDVVAPTLALALGIAGSAAVAVVGERLERQRMRQLFERFVPAAVVDDVIERTDDDLRLGAVRRDGTVIFTDLRGFTTFSERLRPEQVVAVVNRYLTEMSDAILAHGGTLVSYMGDGIMALFGAPLEQSDHADRALDAVREMLGVRLPRFNAWMAAEGFDHAFRMGIGVHSGPVMSGNVGSPRRLEYTAIGDTTNTASRLEGMTKSTPHQAFVSTATRSCARNVDDLNPVGEVAVRGRSDPIEVWSLGS